MYLDKCVHMPISARVHVCVSVCMRVHVSVFSCVCARCHSLLPEPKQTSPINFIKPHTSLWHISLC